MFNYKHSISGQILRNRLIYRYIYTYTLQIMNDRVYKIRIRFDFPKIVFLVNKIFLSTSISTETFPIPFLTPNLE